MKHYFLAFKKIFDFRGEATTKEFWSFFIINIIVSFLLIIFCKKFLKNDLIHEIYKWVSLVSLYSLGFRRLRNAGYSVWLFLIPIINLIFASLPPKEVKNNEN